MEANRIEYYKDKPCVRAKVHMLPTKDNTQIFKGKDTGEQIFIKF